MKYIMYCNNRKKKKYNNNSSSSSSNNNKCYIVLLVILYVCLLNIIINNVSLSNEDTTTIISKQEFQKLLDIKHNVTGLKKISETMFELMFNTNDDKEEVKSVTATANDNKEVKPTTAPNDVSMKENKGLGEGTTRGTMSEEEMEKRRKKLFEEAKELIETRDKPEVIYTVDEEKLNLDTIVDLCAVLNSSILDSISNSGLMEDAILKVYDNLAILIDQVKLLKSKQPTSQEIAEIVNKAISSYSESAKQSMKESNLYQTQMIQMLKDLTNKVDRLENGAQKEIVKTDTQSTAQTFVNGSYSSKKIYIENISNKDLECEEDSIIRNKTTQNDEVVKAIKPVEVDSNLLDDSILNEGQRIVNDAKTQSQEKSLNAQIEQTEEVAEEEKSEQEKSVNAQELLQEQNKIASTNEQQQTLEPINQNTATMLKMGEQEEKSEQEKSTSAQAQPLQEQDVLVEKVVGQSDVDLHNDNTLEPQQLNFKGLIEAEDEQNQALVSCMFKLDQENQNLQKQNLKLNIQCKNQQLIFMNVLKDIKGRIEETRKNTIEINNYKARLESRMQQFQALNDEVKNSKTFVYLGANNTQHKNLQNSLGAINPGDNEEIEKLKAELINSDKALKNFGELKMLK